MPNPMDENLCLMLQCDGNLFITLKRHDIKHARKKKVSILSNAELQNNSFLKAEIKRHNPDSVFMSLFSPTQAQIPAHHCCKSGSFTG